ncbi:peptide chain release factor 1 [Novimethylophilus kurashikiensis]|uniref:Peptide chain release factor 1 n=1 Tax=Novimethylophilus kurashikiensis TaxID=1825523 RepID=A0A2R5F7X3_9PROT|nr:PCRF domain-containing protein [Novimethylophilus kurashikiensis]GBG14316.1 peptide chain release factor 1 [Novimethylophilus kurashikiensis]
MKLTLEIRAAEGGEDAKLLVHDQAAIYQRYAARNGIKASVETRGHL